MRLSSFSSAKVIAMFVLILACNGCESLTSRRPSDPGPTSFTKPQSIDSWQRMKQCAEQAETMAKSVKFVEGERSGNLQTLTWENHYSPKYDRCYIKISYAHYIPNKNAIRGTHEELWDVFERRRLSSFTDINGPEQELFCDIPTDDKVARHQCAACLQFIKDHMDN
jgi:hypothetical protein